MERVRAATRHVIPSRAPLRLRIGDVVTAEARHSEWPAFVFVESDRGSGWVPARHLSGIAGPARVVRAYDTTELATSAGEVLEIIERDDESGWHWCRAADGREGWVPMRTLEPHA